MPTDIYGEGSVSIANQRNAMSLYTCGAHHLEAFKAAYPAYKTGTGCINFREQVDTPHEAIAVVIRYAMKYPTGH